METGKLTFMFYIKFTSSLLLLQESFSYKSNFPYNPQNVEESDFYEFFFVFRQNKHMRCVFVTFAQKCHSRRTSL